MTSSSDTEFSKINKQRSHDHGQQKNSQVAMKWLSPHRSIYDKERSALDLQLKVKHLKCELPKQQK